MSSDLPPFVVAISRQLGCGGSYVGRLVAQRLRYHYVDREVLEQAARQLGLSEGEVEDREERVSRGWEQVLKVFGMGGPESPYSPPPIRVVFDEELFRVEAAILRKMAGEQSCVIVGKGGAHVLRDHPRLLRLFLHAPIDFRVRRLMQVYGIADPAEARARIEESDENRERFHRSLMGTHWTDATGYDVCIDTGTVDFIAAREMIVTLVESLRRT
jgi:cytidylate kinase